MEEDTDSRSTTNRRTLLRTIASGALAATALAGAASADDGVSPQNCERMVTQYRCVETNCDCCSCTCDCTSERQFRTCCEDRYGDLVRCGTWQPTGDCCTSC